MVPNTNHAKFSITCPNSKTFQLYAIISAKHGKAEADCAIGCLSVHLDAVVRSGSQEFVDAGEIVRYCNIKLRVHNDDDATCCHWQWHYFEVSNINCDESIKCETVKGTWNFHSVRNVGIPGIIEVCKSSCFCEVCFVNESGQCKNAVSGRFCLGITVQESTN